MFRSLDEHTRAIALLGVAQHRECALCRQVADRNNDHAHTLVLLLDHEEVSRTQAAAVVLAIGDGDEPLGTLGRAWLVRCRRAGG